VIVFERSIRRISLIRPALLRIWIHSEPTASWNDLSSNFASSCKPKTDLQAPACQIAIQMPNVLQFSGSPCLALFAPALIVVNPNPLYNRAGNDATKFKDFRCKARIFTEIPPVGRTWLDEKSSPIPI